MPVRLGIATPPSIGDHGAMAPETSTDTSSRPRRRFPKDPTPRFKPEVHTQLDAVNGCPELMLGGDHLAREVWKEIERLDLAPLREGYSALGRRGYDPARLLALLVYGSLIGLHHSTKLARACKTDLALRWLSGGWAPSSATLRRFRLANAQFLESALEQTVALAAEDGLLDLDEIAVDSARLRANASTSSARTVKRSKQRLAELEANPPAVDDPIATRAHQEKVAKHKAALAMCDEQGRTNLILTSPSAGLLKFPDGASAPGHRVSIVSSGSSSRIVVGLLIDPASSDFGKLGPLVETMSATFERLGIGRERPIVITADAGYFSEADLSWVDQNSDVYDVLINEPVGRNGSNKGMFKRDAFHFLDDGTVQCPVGRAMNGPYRINDEINEWRGDRCSDCPLKAKCTNAARRTLSVRHEFDRLRDQMRERMSRPGAKRQYGRRIATVEPVFAHLQDNMGYRRVSSRHELGATSEITLKMLAHNISRLIARRSLCLVLYVSPLHCTVTLSQSA